MASLNRVAGPAAEPIVTADVCAFLKLPQDPDGTYPDAPTVLMMQRAARQLVEATVNRTLITTTWAETLDGFPGAAGYFSRAARQSGDPMNYVSTSSGEIRLYRPPFVEIASVTYLDTTGAAHTLDPGRFRVVGGSDGPARLILNGYAQWPVTFAGPAAVTVTYTAGYGDTPDDVPDCAKLAICLLVQHWFYQPDGMAAGFPDFVEAVLIPLDWGGTLG